MAADMLPEEIATTVLKAYVPTLTAEDLQILEEWTEQIFGPSFKHLHAMTKEVAS